MNAIIKTAGVSLVLLATAAAGACGGSTPAPEPPAGGVDTPPGEDLSPPDGPEGSDGTDTPAPEGTGELTPPPAAGKKNTPVQDSAYIEDLKKAGLNPSKLPPIGKMPLAQKKKIMPAMQKAMGFSDCTGCHVEGDFKKKTKNLKIAAHMWDNFVVNVRDEKGGPVFCDSCHAGDEHILNRKDMDAVKAFMESDYEGKLTRADGEEMNCSTCHGETMELKIIEKLWKITD